MAETTSSAAAAKLAMAEITVAAATIPAAWPIARIVYMNQCDPETIMSRGGGDWMAIAEQLGTVPGKLDGAVSAVSAEQWSGEDRSAFEGHTKAYGVQVVAIQILATTVSVTMISVGVILLCLVVAYAIVSTILALWAAFILAAAATVVGAPVAASALASANSSPHRRSASCRGSNGLSTRPPRQARRRSPVPPPSMSGPTWAAGTPMC